MQFAKHFNYFADHVVSDLMNVHGLAYVLKHRDGQSPAQMLTELF